MGKVILTPILLFAVVFASSVEAVAQQVNEADVISGVDAARGRVARHIEGFNANVDTAETEQLILEALAAYEGENGWSPRAVQLAAEVIGVGALSRIHYGESVLEYEEVAAFLPFLDKIINSWKHGGPR
jgi:hypothetical protein